MELLDAIKKRRSIRRFKQEPVPDSSLLALVEAASVAPSGGNSQPLRYVIVRTPSRLKELLSLTSWAVHVKPRRDPQWGVNAPAAFIAVCSSVGGDNALVFADAGAAIQSMLLRAVDLGLGCCWLGAFNKAKAAELLGFSGLHCLFLVAVGVPGEEPVMREIGLGDLTAYSLDKNDVLQVPKYSAASIAELL